MSEEEKLMKVKELIDKWDEQCIDATDAELKELDYKYMLDIKRVLNN